MVPLSRTLTYHNLDKALRPLTGISNVDEGTRKTAFEHLDSVKADFYYQIAAVVAASERYGKLPTEADPNRRRLSHSISRWAEEVYGLATASNLTESQMDIQATLPVAELHLLREFEDELATAVTEDRKPREFAVRNEHGLLVGDIPYLRGDPMAGLRTLLEKLQVKS